MAAKLDTDTATNIEEQFLQIAYHMNNLENANVDGDGAALTDNIQIVPDNEARTTVVTVTLTIDSSVSGTGILSTPQEFLVPAVTS